MGASRSRAAILAATAAGVVLAPYATLSLPFRQALHVQAGAILGLVLVPRLVARSRAGGREGRPQATVQGVAVLLYAGAAAIAALVALVRGNDVGAILGQAVSLGLLPLAWWSSQASATRWQLRAYALGIGGAVALASTFHVTLWLLSASSGQWVERWFLDHAISASPAAALAALLILPFQEASDRLARRAATVGFWLIASLVVGSAIRGLWVTLALALAMAAVLDHRLARTIGKRVLVPATALAVVGGAAGAAIDHHAGEDGSNLLVKPRLLEVLDPRRSGLRVQGTGDGEDLLLSFDRGGKRRWWILTLPLAVERSSAFLLRAQIRGEGPGEGAVGLQWVDATGTALSTSWRSATAASGWRRVTVIAAAPPDAAAFRLSLRFSPETRNVWQVRGIEVHRFGPRLLGPVLSQLHYTNRRLASMIAPDLGDDPSLAFRVKESRVLLQRFAEAPTLVKVSGHGLGATFSIPDPPGGVAPRSRSTAGLNYIHNFYLFLLFKMGIAGTVMVLSAIAAWTWSLLATARRLPPGSTRHLAVGVAAAWIAYCAWSLTSPEILDFRMAPLWGLLLGCLSRPAPEQDAGDPDPPSYAASEDASLASSS